LFIDTIKEKIRDNSLVSGTFKAPAEISAWYLMAVSQIIKAGRWVGGVIPYKFQICKVA